MSEVVRLAIVPAKRRSGLPAVRRRSMLTAATGVLIAAACPVGAWAATAVTPYAGVAVERDSNVFMRPSGDPVFAASGNSQFGDTIFDYLAGVDGIFSWGPNSLTLTGEGTKYTYDRFSLLNHFEYRLDGKLDWRPGAIVDVLASYEQHRYMPPFTDTLTDQLLVDTERTGSTTLQILVSPKWRLGLTPGLHELDTPIPGFADFSLREEQAAAELDYLGLGKLIAGLRFQYFHGKYSGITNATEYVQRTAELTSSYQVTGLSTFSADVGYTRRGTEPNAAGSVFQGGVTNDFAGYAGAIGTTSSFAGTLNYSRQITGKTSGELSIFRRLDSYAAGANPQIGTGGEVRVTWKADVRFTVGLDYRLIRESVQGGVVVVDVENRSDRVENADLDVTYTASDWLTVRPYFRWTDEQSNFALGTYSATTVGIELTARMQR